MRLFTVERCVVVQQFLTGVFGGLGRVVVRLQKHRRQHGWTCPQLSPSLCSRSWWLERGPYLCLAMMKMKVKDIHTCHSHCMSEVRASERRQACEMNGNSTWFSVLSFEKMLLPPSGACETEASIPPAITRTAELGGRLRFAQQGRP